MNIRESSNSDIIKAILFASILVLLILPVLVTSHLPLGDSENHEARLAVLRDLLFPPFSSRFYRIDTLFLPNIGFDLAGVSLLSMMGPALAGRVIFATTVLATMVGAVLLSRAAGGRWLLVALAAGLSLYNLPSSLGFLNYGMGVALVFWVLIGRIHLERRIAWRGVFGGAGGLAILLCHVGAFGIYAVLVSGTAIDALRRRRFGSVALTGLELLPAAIAFAAMSTGGQGRMHYDLPYWHTKLINIVKSFTCDDIVGDIAWLLGIAALSALLIAGKKIRIDKRFLPGLAVLAVLYFFVPAHISAGSYVDSRIPPVLLILTLTFLDFELPSSRVTGILVIVLAGAYSTKQLSLAAAWHRQGQLLSQVEGLMDRLPEGAVLIQAECIPDPGDILQLYRSHQPPLSHAASMGGFSDTRFVATGFTLKGQQPIAPLSDYEPYKTFQNTIPRSVCDIIQYKAILSAAKSLVSAQAAAGHPPPPVYLVLVRPPLAGALTGSAPLAASMAGMELYAVDGTH